MQVIPLFQDWFSTYFIQKIHIVIMQIQEGYNWSNWCLKIESGHLCILSKFCSKYQASSSSSSSDIFFFQKLTLLCSMSGSEKIPSFHHNLRNSKNNQVIYTSYVQSRLNTSNFSQVLKIVCPQDIIWI